MKLREEQRVRIKFTQFNRIIRIGYFEITISRKKHFSLAQRMLLFRNILHHVSS